MITIWEEMLCDHSSVSPWIIELQSPWLLQFVQNWWRKISGKMSSLWVYGLMVLSDSLHEVIISPILNRYLTCCQVGSNFIFGCNRTIKPRVPDNVSHTDTLVWIFSKHIGAEIFEIL